MNNYETSQPFMQLFSSKQVTENKVYAHQFEYAVSLFDKIKELEKQRRNQQIIEKFKDWND
jgi:hypothetical protein